MIVCATWAQAENISTATHKATSCHNAAGMRVQSLRNANMRPESGLAALRRRWANKYLLVIEEVSMISPELFNMLLYRSFWGRKASPRTFVRHCAGRFWAHVGRHHARRLFAVAAHGRQFPFG